MCLILYQYQLSPRSTNRIYLWQVVNLARILDCSWFLLLQLSLLRGVSCMLASRQYVLSGYRRSQRIYCAHFNSTREVGSFESYVRLDSHESTCSLVLGILYSVDLKMLRWKVLLFSWCFCLFLWSKRFPLLAAGCILLVRALTVHVGFFLHARFESCCMSWSCRLTFHSPQPINIIPPSLMHVVAVMTIYSIVIAIFKAT
jgi:hypothetical protein